LLDLPDMLLSRLSLNPGRIVRAEFSGDGHSVRVCCDDSILVGILVAPDS
jgi:hypothetical protein